MPTVRVSDAEAEEPLAEDELQAVTLVRVRAVAVAKRMPLLAEPDLKRFIT